MKQESTTTLPHFESRAEWALYLSRVGFSIIPIRPGTKATYHPWPEWEKDQSEEHIRQHWLENPDDDIAIFTNSLFVVDCDHAASQLALKEIKARHRIHASIIVNTRKGTHEYFALPTGVSARQGGYCTDAHPERIDIRTGHAYIIAPGSTGKKIVTWTINTVENLTPVTQAFVDDIARHNGSASRPDRELALSRPGPLGDAGLPRIRECLQYISPDIGQPDWIKVGMAICRETGGSDAGMELFDDWSKGSVKKYKGIHEIQAKWRSFNKEVPDPVTIGTLILMAREAGGSIKGSSPDSAAWYEMAVEEATYASSDVLEEQTHKPVPIWSNPFEAASVSHHHGELENEIQHERPFMGGLALMGQATVIYAAPNTGKTLLALKLIIDSVKQGDIDPEKVIYFNLDDSSAGLVEKSKILARYGVTKVIGNGYYGFTVDKLRPWLEDAIANNVVKGWVIIIDTLTRVVDTNHKGHARQFTDLATRVCAGGAAVVGLGHTRKNPGVDGKPVFQGTNDFHTDFHTALMLEEVASSAEVKTVAFTNFKRRGSVKVKAAYTYSNKPTNDYEALLSSVRSADDAELEAVSRKLELNADLKTINVIKSHIRRGINTKKALSAAVPKAAEVSRAKVEHILLKYAGSMAGTHFWKYTVQARGAHVYELLVDRSGSAPGSQFPSAPGDGPAPGARLNDPFMPYPDDFEYEHEDADSLELEDMPF